ncbi:MAG: hypothetical protein M3Q07_08450, partial [Pseudobdellovibrionaceae bacterium]|nr:hypothetical protein [Pseudobdellovibrionaceae bacterium]
MWNWILMLALCAGWQEAPAVDAKSPQLSLTDSYSLKWAALDNPAALRAWAREQMSTLDPATQGSLWVQAVAAYLRVRDMGESDAEQRQLLSQALELSALYLIPHDALYTLKTTQMDLQMIEDHGVGAVLAPTLRDRLFRDKENLADQLRLPGRKAQISLEWGQFMLESGRDGEGIKKMHEAMRELNKASDVTDLEIMQAKQFYAGGILNIQSNEKSKLIYSELGRFCEVRKPRNFCLIIDHDYAYLLLADDSPANVQAALAVLTRALAGAEELQDENFVAIISTSMIRLLDKLGRNDEALQHGLRAMSIFKKYNDGV